MRTNYTMYYSVADHLFAIEASAAQEALLTNYAPFRFSQEGPCAPLFTIHVQDASMPSADGWEHVYTDTSDEDMPRIEMYKRPGEWLFRVSVSNREHDGLLGRLARGAVIHDAGVRTFCH